MSLIKTIEQVCDVFRENDTSAQDGRIACWQIIVASIANDFGRDHEAAEHHLAKEVSIALQQLEKICRLASPEETMQ